MLIDVTLGGQKRTLLFDLGTLEHVGDLINGDGFQFAVNIKEYKHFRKDLSTIICAGLRAYYDLEEKAYDFTYDQVDKWTKRIGNMGEAIGILAAFHNAFKTEDVPGEGDTDTQAKSRQLAGHNGNGAGGVESSSKGAKKVQLAGAAVED